MQANPERGQAALSIGGESHVLQLSPAALARIRQKTGMGFKALASAIEGMGDDPDFEVLGTVIWAAMVDNHPEATLERTLSTMPDGGLEALMEAIGELFRAAMPKASVEASAQAVANPPKAAAKS